MLDIGQSVDKLRRHHLGLGGGGLLVEVAIKQQSSCYLFLQLLVELLHVNADIVGAYFLLGLPLIEVVGEDNGFHQRYYLLDSLD